jgi:hypothetical protein
MDVDDDGADEVLVALSLVPTPSTSASASIYAPRQTSDAVSLHVFRKWWWLIELVRSQEVQCDPSETETT